MKDEPSRTAEVVCYMRATDQGRQPADRILDDPYAKSFLGPVMRTALATLEATRKLGEKTERLFPGLSTYILARHRFIDDALVHALAGDDLAQVVLLGAGYDTRAYRFADQLKGRPVFELDYPSTSRRKAQIVASAGLPAADVRVVEIDFNHQSVADRLLGSGFQRQARTFFVWEGVSMYLSREAVKDTFRTLHGLGGAGSELTMDYWFLLDTADLISNVHRMSASFLHFLGEPITFGIHPEDVGPFMARNGWAVEDLATPADLELRYVTDGRSVYPANYVLHAKAQ